MPEYERKPNLNKVYCDYCRKINHEMVKMKFEGSMPYVNYEGDRMMRHTFICPKCGTRKNVIGW